MATNDEIKVWKELLAQAKEALKKAQVLSAEYEQRESEIQAIEAKLTEHRAK